MALNKQLTERICYVGILIFIVVNAIINHDSIPAVISAICGITYTIFAGKGRPFCYLFGVCGSGFYGFLSFQNALWGNLLLYILYYIPMQILGFFKWKNHLKTNRDEIIKIKLPAKQLILLLIISIVLIIITEGVLLYFNDTHPILDSTTTILSLGGMYLTVRRTVEQWYFWITVNALSLFMWFTVALSGAKVWSTVIMWAVYLVLGIYFCIEWHKELNNTKC